MQFVSRTFSSCKTETLNFLPIVTTIVLSISVNLRCLIFLSITQTIYTCRFIYIIVLGSFIQCFTFLSQRALQKILVHSLFKAVPNLENPSQTKNKPQNLSLRRSNDTLDSKENQEQLGKTVQPVYWKTILGQHFCSPDQARGVWLMRIIWIGVGSGSAWKDEMGHLLRLHDCCAPETHRPALMPLLGQCKMKFWTLETVPPGVWEMAYTYFFDRDFEDGRCAGPVHKTGR